MHSGLEFSAGIRLNPAETQWKRPLWHIAQLLMRNVDSILLDRIAFEFSNAMFGFIQ